MSIDRGDAERLSGLLRNSDLLGRLAVLNGFIGEEDLARRLEEHKSASPPSPLGEFLVSRKALTSDQLRQLLAQQKAIEDQDRAAGLPDEPGAGERTLGHYRLVRMLGEGGGGIVWKAWDTKLCRWVALKEPRGHRPVARERFIREARTAAKLNHPNLVEVHEVTFDSEQDFIVMEYIDGRSLDGLTLPERDAATLMSDIADAVDYMHASGVIHRDLKPQNIIVDAKGVGHLGDFGIAKVFGNAPLTREGAPIGTPQYMAPEQVEGKSETLGPAADVYGLGATLYFCLAGQAPYAEEVSFEAILTAIRSKDPPFPKSLKPDLAGELDVIVRRAMARNPRERYSSAAALRDDLRRFLRGEAILARPDGLLRKAVRWSKRHGRLVAAVLLAALASAFGVGFATLSRHDVLRRRQETYEAGIERADQLWQKATGLIRAGQPSPDALVAVLEEAQGLYLQAATAGDDKAYPWLMVGRCRMLLGMRVEAEAAWTQGLSRKPFYGPALFERGKSALGRVVRLGLLQGSPRSGRRPEAEPADPLSEEARLWQAKGEKDLAAARQSKDLEQPSVRCLEGMLELSRGNYQAAATALAQYVAEYPWDADALTYLGAAQYQLGNFEEARTRWLRALEMQPTAGRHKLLGDVAYGLRRFPEAIDHYSRALALDGGNAGAQCNRGLARQASGDRAGAMEDFNGALATAANFARAYNCRGIAWLERSDLDRALEDFERAAECNEYYAEAHNNLGNTHVRRHEVEVGIREFGIALELRPNYAEARFNRGLAYLLKGDLDLAIQDFEKASTLDAQDPESLYHLALTHRTKGNAAQSVKEISRAIEVGGESWAKRAQARELLREWTGK